MQSKGLCINLKARVALRTYPNDSNALFRAPGRTVFIPNYDAYFDKRPTYD